MCIVSNLFLLFILSLKDDILRERCDQRSFGSIKVALALAQNQLR